MKRYFSFIVLSFLLFACAKEQPKVSWLKIEKWKLQKNENAVHPQGELTSDISQVYVNVDGKSLGVYELPAKIPVIADGKHNVVLLPGIRDNNINSTKTSYPFYERYQKEIDFVINDTIEIEPTTQYYSNLKFLIEDFESPSMMIEVAEESNAFIKRKNDPDILEWGNRYGAVELNDTDSMLVFATNFGESFPKGGADVYLEFDYYNTNSMLISTLSFGGGNFYTDPYFIVTPQEEEKAKWKHMYINLTENVSYRFNSPSNEIQFSLVIEELGKESYFYIDNLKIIYSE